MSEALGSSAPPSPSPLVVAFVREHCTLEQAAHTAIQDLSTDFLAWKNPSGVGVWKRLPLLSELAAYLRHVGCTEDLASQRWTGVRLHFPRLWLPALDPRSRTARLQHPVSEDDLAASLAWIQQHLHVRRQEDQQAEAALLTQPHHAWKDVGAMLATRRAAQARVTTQYQHYMTTRHVPFLSGGAKPSTADEIQLACEVLLEYREEGFSSPLVLEVVAFLQQLIQHQAVPRNARKLARALLQALYAPVVPELQTAAATATHIVAYRRRVALLECYEQHKAQVDAIWETVPGARARLAALRAAYPGLREEEGPHWQGKTPAYIASSLAGSLFGLTATTVDKTLHQARKERARLMENEGSLFKHFEPE